MFLSSTFRDLHSERNVVLEIARDTGWRTVHFETTPGLSDPEVLTRVHRDIRSCDVFANIIASRYGTQVPELEISYTHFELALARKLGKPIVSLVLAETEASSKPASIGYQPHSDAPALVNLWRDIQEAEAEGVCIKYEYSIRPRVQNGLAGVARVAFTEAKRRLLEGAFRPGILATESEIKRFLSHRDDVPPSPYSSAFMLRRMEDSQARKAEFSEYFWDFNLPLISFQNTLNLCFGAGMTSTLLLLAFLDALRWTQLFGRARIVLSTNNVMLPLMLADRIQQLNCDLHLIPGRIGKTYAATWSDETVDPELSHNWKIPETHRGLFVGGVSLRPEADSLQLSKAFAFYRTVTAKSGCAGVLFIDFSNDRNSRDTELISSFPGGCMSSQGDPLPLSFCIGASTRARRDVFGAALSANGFDQITPSYGDSEFAKSFPLIATNHSFRRIFGPLIG
jgi:hypothetical protein